MFLFSFSRLGYISQIIIIQKHHRYGWLSKRAVAVQTSVLIVVIVECTVLFLKSQSNAVALCTTNISTADVIIRYKLARDSEDTKNENPRFLFVVSPPASSPRALLLCVYIHGWFLFFLSVNSSCPIKSVIIHLDTTDSRPSSRARRIIERRNAVLAKNHLFPRRFRPGRRISAKGGGETPRPR